MTKDSKIDLSFKDKQGKVDLRILMTGVVQKLLGTALDYARISGMSDRSFTQLQRSLKDSFYDVRDFTVQMLEDSGYIEKSPENKNETPE